MQLVEHPETGDMIPTPQPLCAIRVRYNAGNGTLTARTDEGRLSPSRSVRVAFEPALPVATNAAIAAQEWLDRHMEYFAELMPHSCVYGRDRFFNYRITGPKRDAAAGGQS